MAKNKATPKNPKKMSFVERFRIPKNEREHVLRLIEATEQCITKQRTSLDELFTEQAKRLRKQLESLGKK